MKYLLVLLFVPLMIFGQNNIIKGTVTKGADSSKAKNITVKLIELNLVSTTDSNGTFIFSNIEDGVYSFEIITDNFIPFLSKPLLVANNSIYILIFHISKLPFNFDKPILSTLKRNDNIYNSTFPVNIIETKDFSTKSSLTELLNHQSGFQTISGFSPFGNTFYYGLLNDNVISLDGIKLTSSNNYLLNNLFPIEFINKLEISGQPSSSFNKTDNAPGINNLFSNKNKNISEVAIKGSLNSIKGNSFSTLFSKYISLNNNFADSLFIIFYINYKYNNKKISNPALFNFPQTNSQNIYTNIDVWFSNKLRSNFFAFYTNNKLKYPSFSYFYNSTLNINKDNNFSALTSAININYLLGTKSMLTAEIIFNNSIEDKDFYYSPFNNIKANKLTNTIYFSSNFGNLFSYNIGLENNYEYGVFSGNNDSEYINRNNSMFFISDFRYKEISASINFHLTNYAKNKFIFSPDLSALIRINNSSSLRISYGLGYNLPNSIYLFPFYKYEGYDIYYKGNKCLKPEFTQCFLVGINYTDFDYYNINLNLFNNKTTNIIKSYNYTNTENNIVFSNINQGEINNTGAQCNIDLSLLNNLDIKINYTHLISNDKHGNTLLFRTPNTANLFVKYIIPRLNFSVNANLHWIDQNNVSDEQYLNNLNFYYSNIPVYTIKSYWLIDLFAVKQISPTINSEFGINNLLNYRTQKFGNFREREFYFALKFNWQQK